MLRQLLATVILGIALTTAGGGCRSCSSCHDYDGPVANCGCGCGRTGSVSNCGACSPCDNGCPCDCAGGACASGDCATGGCNCPGQGEAYSDGYYDQSTMDGYVE